MQTHALQHGHFVPHSVLRGAAPTNNLNRHLPPSLSTLGPVHYTICTGTEALAKLIVLFKCAGSPPCRSGPAIRTAGVSNGSEARSKARCSQRGHTAASLAATSTGRKC